VVVTPEDSPAKRTQDVRDSPTRRALDGHCCYPAAQRCGCGLNLRSAVLWTVHITDLAIIQAASAS
jgi:hypothetical protein